MKDILGREIQVGMTVAHLTRSSSRVHARAASVVEFVDVTGNWNYMPEKTAVIVHFCGNDGPIRSKPILGRNLLILSEEGTPYVC